MKTEEFVISKTRDLDLDLGSGHVVYSSVALIDFWLIAKFNLNRSNYKKLPVEEQTDRQKALSGRLSRGVDSIIQDDPKKLAPFSCALTLPNINRFSKLFDCHLRCGGVFSDSIITNFLLILTVK